MNAFLVTVMSGIHFKFVFLPYAIISFHYPQIFSADTTKNSLVLSVGDRLGETHRERDTFKYVIKWGGEKKFSEIEKTLKDS